MSIARTFFAACSVLALAFCARARHVSVPRGLRRPHGRRPRWHRSCRTRPAGIVRSWRCSRPQRIDLLGARDQPQHAARTVEHGIGQGHAMAPLIEPGGQRDPGDRSPRAPHRPAPAMRYGRPARGRDGPGRASAASPRGSPASAHIAPRPPADRPPRPASRAGWPAAAARGSSRLSRRCLKLRSSLSAGATRSSTCTTCTCVPGHLLVRKLAQHHPGRVAAAHREGEPAALLHRRPRMLGDQRRGALGHGLRIGQHLDLHALCSITRWLSWFQTWITR